MKPILYTSKNCVFCGPVKKKLKKKGIDFKEVSIDTREGKKMASKKGIKVVPTLEVEGETLVGNEIDKFSEMF